eukprot:749722-Hanusia_phi.AAC.2
MQEFGGWTAASLNMGDQVLDAQDLKTRMQPLIQDTMVLRGLFFDALRHRKFGRVFGCDVLIGREALRGRSF